MAKQYRPNPFRSIIEEVEKTKQPIPHQDLETNEYRLAFTDAEFLLRDELRPVRLQLELLRPELILRDKEIDKTIVFFGSARLPYRDQALEALKIAEENLSQAPNDSKLIKAKDSAEKVYDNSKYLDEAVKLASISSIDKDLPFVVVTGGGPSVMEAANRGAQEVNAPSIALNMMLPDEQVPNSFVTPELTFQFHYFAIRKMHFLMRAQALVAFPGGYGTLDELFEVLTLMQTEKIVKIPLLLFNERFWRNVVNFEGLVEEGTISAEDINLIKYVETAEEAWDHIKNFYKENG